MPFRDSQNQLWTIEVDVPACKRVKRLTQVDLLTTNTQDLFTRLADPINLVDVLYAICQPQADGRGLSDEAFGRLMGVDLEPIAAELLEGLASFIPRLSPGRMAQAKLIRSLMKRAGLMASRVREATDLDQVETKVNQAFDLLEAGIIGTSCTASPASPESIQTSLASLSEV